MRVRLVDDPRAEVGEDVRVGVGAVECQLYAATLVRPNVLQYNASVSFITASLSIR